MLKTLRISEDLALPLDFVTERIAFLARTGAGKSGGMRVLFEAILDAGQFGIFVDPKGDAWGVRAAGVGPGYPVLVMGGDHGDVPLEATAGKVIAEFLVRERVSTVLDVSDFGKAATNRFVTDLASTLYRRNRDVVHVFLDEADMIAGEKFYDPDTLQAIQLIQNKGRHRGFGVTLATQRSAMINKSVLYASGTLIAMQTTAPKDIKIVREWLEVIATPEIAKEIVSVLPTLKTREALIYSPQYLGGHALRITFKTFRTFDSMRTPKPGETRQQPKSLADIDLKAIERDMAETIEHAKQNDPKELKRQIAELKRAQQNNAPDPQMVERAVQKAVGEAEDRFELLQRENVKAINDLRGRLTQIAQLAQLNGNAPALAEYERAKPRVVVDRPAPASRVVRQTPDSLNLPAGEKKVLAALIQFPEGLERKKLSVLVGFKQQTRDAYIARLAGKGFVRSVGVGRVAVTEAGKDALPDFEPLPLGQALLDHWKGKLPSGEWKVLEHLVGSWPKSVKRVEVTEATEFSQQTRDAYLARLAAKQLVISTGRGEVKASDNLFD